MSKITSNSYNNSYTSNQTTNTKYFDQCFRFPNASIQCKKTTQVDVSESATILSTLRKIILNKSEKPFDNTLSMNNCVPMTYGAKTLKFL